MRIFPPILLLCAGISSIALAQIPNPGFELWSSGQPTDWITSNVPSVVTPVTQSTTARSGSSALRGAVVDLTGSPYPPVVWSADNGFPVSQRHATLTGYYQFSPVGGDIIEVTVLMFKNGAVVGGGGLTVASAASSYTQFTAPVFYNPSDTPDTCSILFAIADTSDSGTVDVGSFMLIDDLAFSGTVTEVAIGASASEMPREYGLKQNYPNPFNPATNFEFSVPKRGFVTLKIFDLLGREVATVLSSELEPGTYRIPWNAGALAGGVYIYELQSENIRMSRKFVLMK